MQSVVKKDLFRISSPFNGVSVGIIVPFHGQYSMVHRLVESILRNTWKNTYTIWLVDDCSPNSTFAKTMNDVPNVKTLRLEKHSGFGAAVNAGIMAAEQSYVCILHSDCEIKHPSWLTELGDTLLKRKNEGIKLVCARSNNPVVHAPEMKGGIEDRADDMLVDYPLPLFCALANKELFKRIGMLPEYPYYWYEDEYLHWKMNKWGYRQMIAGRSWIHHNGSATISELWKRNPEIKLVMESNREKCINDMATT